jgi:hypothetical protein
MIDHVESMSKRNNDGSACPLLQVCKDVHTIIGNEVHMQHAAMLSCPQQVLLQRAYLVSAEELRNAWGHARKVLYPASGSNPSDSSPIFQGTATRKLGHYILK